MSKILRNNEGMTLAEILVVVAIIAIMSGIAVPSFLSWLENKRVQSAARDMYSNFRKAQSTAVKNNRNCAVSFNGTTGYTVYVDEDKDFVQDPGEQIIAQVNWSQYRNVQFSVNFPDSSGKPTVAFLPNVLPDTHSGLPNGTVELKSTSGKVSADVVISKYGNISLYFN